MNAFPFRRRGFLAGDRARSLRPLAALAVLFGFGVLPASAQYSFNPANADEQQPGIRYFGSVKTLDGRRIEGATIRLERERVAFVVVSEQDGRYRTRLPLDMTADRIKIACAKDGFEFVRVNVRAAPASAERSAVQADCVLRARAAG